MTRERFPLLMPRRSLLRTGLGAGAGITLGGLGARAQGGPAIVTSEAARPRLPAGVMSGDITADRAIVWAKADRAARMIVDYATTESFQNARRIVGPAALEDSDFTARIDLGGLPAGQQIFYRVVFQDLNDANAASLPVTGRFRTPSAARRDITFVYSGDEAGQGWGINPERGGYQVYEKMRQANPDFFIHQGDQIYADGPILPEVRLGDGTVWKNLTTEAKSKVCESLADYRGAFAYNMMDEHKRRFMAEVPFLVQWDDHETRNNWYPGQILSDPNYKTEKSLSLLSARGKRAMFEYNPFRFDIDDPERVYRAFSHGPMLDVFMLDERSYRGPNSPNIQTSLNAQSAFLGAEQMLWLKQSLLASKATWKLIASDMPISIVVPDLNADVPKGTFEAWANNEHGGPKGRELEVASLLSFKSNDIKNVVWITADVHYASATFYDPSRAQFTDFKPFWEFVSGPINAGTFGPGDIDRTFGPDVKYSSAPAGMTQNLPPSAGKQYYGICKIEAATGIMTHALHDITGTELFKVALDPET